MVTQKIRKPNPYVIAIICLMAFFMGNRLSNLYGQSTNTSFLISIAEAVDGLLPSLSFSKLGLSISFRAIDILIGLFTLVLACAIYFYFATIRKNFKVGEEHGSARYGTLKEALELKDPDDNKNMILSKNISLSMDTRRTFLNDNVMAIGGSGSGKTRYLVEPNLLQMLSSGLYSFVLTDPKGSVVKKYGQAFADKGFDVKILDLDNQSASMGYNPYHYCKSPVDVMKFLNNLMTNTQDENKKGGDDFWDKAGITNLMALSFLIMGTDYECNKNIPRLMELMDLQEASEEDENAKTVIDYVFEDLQEEVNAKLKSGNRKIVLACKNSYEYLACRQYSLYKKSAGKTAKSILVTLGTRLAVFNLPELDAILQKDELHLETIGEPKIRPGKEDAPDTDPDKYQQTALFICISDSDSTFTFLAAIIYQQLFNLLYKQADSHDSGRLPIHTKFILDEFANIGKIPDFERKIATMRSREISVMILLQNLSQLKGMYKDEQWETIYGNCDTTIFLGGKEFSTLEYLSKNIGNTTIDYISIQETKGANGSWSKSNQLIQRPLIAPDEIKRLGKYECLIDVRGHFIYRDQKYETTKHTNFKLSAEADKSRMFRSRDYIDEQRENGSFDQKWFMDLKNYGEFLEDYETYDFTQEMLDYRFDEGDFS